MLFLVSNKYLFIKRFVKLSSCMSAKSFTKSGAGAVPVNMPEDCIYTTPPNGANPSSNMTFIHSHSLAQPTLKYFCYLSFHKFLQEG